MGTDSLSAAAGGSRIWFSTCSRYLPLLLRFAWSGQVKALRSCKIPKRILKISLQSNLGEIERERERDEDRRTEIVFSLSLSLSTARKADVCIFPLRAWMCTCVLLMCSPVHYYSNSKAIFGALSLFDQYRQTGTLYHFEKMLNFST